LPGSTTAHGAQTAAPGAGVEPRDVEESDQGGSRGGIEGLRDPLELVGGQQAIEQPVQPVQKPGERREAEEEAEEARQQTQPENKAVEQRGEKAPEEEEQEEEDGVSPHSTDLGRAGNQEHKRSLTSVEQEEEEEALEEEEQEEDDGVSPHSTDSGPAGNQERKRSLTPPREPPAKRARKDTESKDKVDSKADKPKGGKPRGDKARRVKPKEDREGYTRATRGQPNVIPVSRPTALPVVGFSEHKITKVEDLDSHYVGIHILSLHSD
jgi:hypothetical protein